MTLVKAEDGWALIAKGGKILGYVAEAKAAQAQLTRWNFRVGSRATRLICLLSRVAANNGGLRHLETVQRIRTKRAVLYASASRPCGSPIKFRGATPRAAYPCYRAN